MAKQQNVDWDKIGAEKRDEIAIGQAINLVCSKLDKPTECPQEAFNQMVGTMYKLIVNARLHVKGEATNASQEILDLHKEVSSEGQKLELL